MVKVLTLFSVFMLFSTTLYADKIVVWNLKPQSGVTEKDAVSISAILTSEIEKISKKKIISESELKSVIDGEQIKASCGADDNSCIAEIGAALGAPLSVSGILSKIGDYWIITIQLIDVRKVETISRVTKRFKGRENTLIEALTPIVSELFSDDKNVSESEEPPVKKEKKSEKKKEKKPRTPVSWKKAAGWTFTVAGAIVFAGGAVSNVQMYSARDDFEKTGKDEDSFRMWRGLTVSGYVVGGVFLAGGITLLVFDAVGAKKLKEKNSTVYIFPSKDGFYAGIQGRW